MARKRPPKDAEHEYSFQIEGTISMHVTVNAPTLEEATRIAAESSVVSLCHHCASGATGEWSTSGELDCDPSSSPLVDVTVDGKSDPAAFEIAKAAWGE